MTKGRYNPISAQAMSRSLIPKIYAVTSDRLKKMFDIDKQTMDEIGFTSDIWTSRSNIAFQSLTCHCINKDFELKRFLLWNLSAKIN